jgi:hypothetical protein
MGIVYQVKGLHDASRVSPHATSRHVHDVARATVGAHEVFTVVLSWHLISAAGMESSGVARDTCTCKQEWKRRRCLVARWAIAPPSHQPCPTGKRKPGSCGIASDRRGCTNCARKPGACGAPDISRAQTWRTALPPAPAAVLRTLRAQPIYARRACARKCRSSVRRTMCTIVIRFSGFRECPCRPCGRLPWRTRPCRSRAQSPAAAGSASSLPEATA